MDYIQTSGFNGHKLSIMAEENLSQISKSVIFSSYI